MKFARRAVVIALILGSTSAAAAGLGFMGRGPMAKFTDADHDLFRGALDRALKSDSIGTPVAWKNPNSAASGEVTPQKLFDDGGAPCRTLRVVNRVGTLSSDGVYTMCQREGRWKLKQG